MARKTKPKPPVNRNQRSATKVDDDIGLRIRLRRVELNMSQVHLSNALGVTFQQVQKYEKAMNRISAARLLDVCRVLEVDPNFLLGWQGKPIKFDEAQTNDTVNLRMAQAISLLPMKLRNPVQILVRTLGELEPADLKS